MLNAIRAMSLAAGVLAATFAMAQAPAVGAAPVGSTGLCQDGSYWQGATKQGACRGHHGVKEWYATNPTATAAGPTATATATVAPSVPTTVAPAIPVAAASPVASAPIVTPAAGGGAGQVWANNSSKVYHCSTDRWYGKTKNGQYLTESAAVAQGFRPDHGKACH